ncbi:MAG: hypothetical protein K2W96_15510 [Gemmataceae bacterium]|nr:hypothetical protein [Gemmataceae bacterium]
MATKTRIVRNMLPETVVFAALPGPTRKRTASPYCFRVTHRAADPLEPGCAMQWEVYGGRDIYQVDLERLPNGKLRWHCSCADAVYRGDDGRHACKHVKGLQAQGRKAAEAGEQAMG